MYEVDKNKLYIITFIIDLFLIYILLKFDLYFLDNIFIISLIFIHFVFYYAIYSYNKPIIDCLHYFVFLYPFLSLFTMNIYIKIISLLLLFVIQLLWILENRCILNNKDDDFGFGDMPSIYTLILTILLSIKIGKDMNN